MKRFGKATVSAILFLLTRAVLTLKQPTVIVVAGSSNTSLVKKKVAEALEQYGAVRTNPRSWNAEIGLPLAILYLTVPFYNTLGWLIVLAKAFAALFSKWYPRFVVLEIGFNQPGDMRYLRALLNPHCVIITNADSMYLENFNRDRETLAREYAEITKSMAANDLIILEEGSPVLNAIASVTRARIITYRLTGNVRNGWRVQNVRERNGHQTFAVTDGITTKTIETTIPGEGSRQAWLVAAIVENAYGKQEHDARAT